MGLSISVGYLSDLEGHDDEGVAWFQDSLEALNRVLVANGLNPHVEPRFGTPILSRARLSSFSYRSLHYLRRVYAHVADDPNWSAEGLSEGVDPTKDPVLDDAYSHFTSHLICHSDAEGYYVPQDFEEVIFDEAVPGSMVGSSQRLLRELQRSAPALGIRLAEGQLSNLEVRRVNGVVQSQTNLATELMVWIALYEAARASVQHGTLIVLVDPSTALPASLEDSTRASRGVNRFPKRRIQHGRRASQSVSCGEELRGTVTAC
jgi:hypothetical protein